MSRWDIVTDWNKFYGQVCPVCHRPVMTKEWKHEQHWGSTAWLRDAGYRPDRHAKFVLDKRRRVRLYPVHEDCSGKVYAFYRTNN